MLKELYLKDLYGYLADRRMLFVILAVFLMMLIVGLVFIGNYQQRIGFYEEYLRKNQDNIRVDMNNFALKKALATFMDQPMVEQNTLCDLVFLEQNLLKKPTSLSFISEAEDHLLPNGIRMSYFNMSNPEFFKTPNIMNSSITIDWRNVFIWLISLVCICFAYNAFSGERAQGTLKLMLSNSVRRSDILMAKLLSIVTMISIPVVIGMVFDMLLINLFCKTLTTGWHEALLCLIFFVCSLLFACFNVLVCFLVSLRVKETSAGLNICLLIWIALAIIIPNTGWLAAKKLHPIPSMSSLNEEEERQKDAASKNYSRSWDTRWQGGPPHEKVYDREKYSQNMTDIHRKIWDNYRQDIFHQANQAVLFSSISPFSSFRFASEKIADNGYAGYKNFYLQVVNYAFVYQNFIKEKDMQDSESYHLIWDEPLRTQSFMSNLPVNYGEVPQFTYVSPTIDKTVKSIIGDFLFLSFLCIALFVTVFILFIKYDVS